MARGAEERTVVCSFPEYRLEKRDCVRKSRVFVGLLLILRGAILRHKGFKKPRLIWTSKVSVTMVLRVVLSFESWVVFSRVL